MCCRRVRESRSWEFWVFWWSVGNYGLVLLVFIYSLVFWGFRSSGDWHEILRIRKRENSWNDLTLGVRMFSSRNRVLGVLADEFYTPLLEHFCRTTEFVRSWRSDFESLLILCGNCVKVELWWWVVCVWWFWGVGVCVECREPGLWVMFEWMTSQLQSS